jgi:hypothetical protein
MLWLLTVLMIEPDGTTTAVPVGIMASEEICHIGGTGYGAVLTKENPALRVKWRCDKLGAPT